MGAEYQYRTSQFPEVETDITPTPEGWTVTFRDPPRHTRWADREALYVRAMAYGMDPLPEGAMRVAPGSDAVVWKQCADYKAEL